MTDKDDDEEALVQQVLAENPVDERGVRDEWVQQVGWHRKEHVGLLLRGGAGAAQHQERDRKIGRGRVGSHAAKVETDWKPHPGSEQRSISNGWVDPPQKDSSAIQPVLAWRGVSIVVALAVVLFILRFVLGFYSRRKYRRSVSFNLIILCSSFLRPWHRLGGIC